MSDLIRVLLVDDDRQLARLISLRLSSNGFTVHCAVDGVEGLTAARERVPHVILLDYLMPRMDGLEFLERLRETPELASLPVVMLSANAGVLARKRALDLGARFVLSKPYETKALCEALRVAAQSRGDSLIRNEHTAGSACGQMQEGAS